MSTTSIRRSRPTNWKAAAPELPANSLTFGAQTKLPKLPVPELTDTFSRLKESLKPIALSEAEFATVSKKIDEFAVSEAPGLQKRLVARAEQLPHWLEQWWDDGGYLGYRDSVSIHDSHLYR